jgi:hypothetical protein
VLRGDPGRRPLEQKLRKIVPKHQGLVALLGTADLGLVEFTALMVFGLGLTAVWVSLLAYSLVSLIFLGVLGSLSEWIQQSRRYSRRKTG